MRAATAWLTLTSIGLVPFMTGQAKVAEAARDQASRICGHGATDTVLRALSEALVPHARRLFSLRMSDAMTRKTTVFRCLEGKALLCTSGANLPCGKANTSRELPGVASWCRDNKQSDSVPMSVTGHDTIYRWGCIDGKPRIVAKIDTVDQQGFRVQMWKDTK